MMDTTGLLATSLLLSTMAEEFVFIIGSLILGHTLPETNGMLTVDTEKYVWKLQQANRTPPTTKKSKIGTNTGSLHIASDQSRQHHGLGPHYHPIGLANTTSIIVLRVVTHLHDRNYWDIHLIISNSVF